MARRCMLGRSSVRLLGLLQGHKKGMTPCRGARGLVQGDMQRVKRGEGSSGLNFLAMAEGPFLLFSWTWHSRRGGRSLRGVKWEGEDRK